MIRIGIVDDEKQERDQLKQALARFGAENGTELNVQEFDCAAVYLAAQDRDFDILYLDIDMPQMSGMELAEKSGRQIKTSSSFLHEFAAIRAERVQCRRTGLYCKADTVVLLPYVSDAGAEGAAKACRSKGHAAAHCRQGRHHDAAAGCSGNRLCGGAPARPAVQPVRRGR